MSEAELIAELAKLDASDLADVRFGRRQGMAGSSAESVVATVFRVRYLSTASQCAFEDYESSGRLRKATCRILPSDRGIKVLAEFDATNLNMRNTISITATVRVALLLALLSVSAIAQKHPASRSGQGNAVAAKAFTGPSWAIAAPENWKPFSPLPSPAVLYLIGDGKPGVPLFDGTLSPLKAGLMVEVFPKGAATLKEHVDRDFKELKTSHAFEMLQDPTLEEVTLKDGATATLLIGEFVRLQNRRVSFQSKLYCVDAAGRHVVASSFVTCSRPGRLSVKAMKMAELLRASVLTLVLDPQKLDLAVVRAAYEKHDWGVDKALVQISQANKLLDREQHTDAERLYRAAIDTFACLPAAHNGLAWSLLQDKQASKEKLHDALHEAKLAVEQTETLDYTALDTLAFAYDRNDDRDQARKAIEAALKLKPNDPELVARLKSLQE